MDKLFDTKRNYIGRDGEEYINMCIPVVTVSKLEGNSVEKLNADCNGRIDTFIWNNVAKNMDMIDIVMYANHIFNPFAVKEGEIFNIPSDNDAVYQTSDEPTLPDGTKYSNDSNGKKKMTYAERVQYLARMGLGLK